MWPFCRRNKKCFSKHDMEKFFLKILDRVLKAKCHKKKNRFESGTLTLSTGKHEGSVVTKKQPTKVYLSGQSCHQVCGANQDLYAAEVIPNGFKFTAIVANSFLKLDWIAEFEPCEEECHEQTERCLPIGCEKPNCA